MDVDEEETKPSFVIRCDGPSCARTNVPHKCGRCQNAYYCSVACQRKDWVEGKHKEICRAVEPVLEEALHRVSSDANGRLPRETDRCHGRNCVGATLKFPFFVGACGQHWVCPNCVVRAAVANPASVPCPQCGGRSHSSTNVTELACEHMSAAGWYLSDPRLAQDEKTAIAKRILAAHALVKEGYFEAARDDAVRRSPLYIDVEVCLRSSIMLLGKDPGTVEEVRKGLAMLRETFIRRCDGGLGDYQRGRE
jgi:MYND finger